MDSRLLQEIFKERHSVKNSVGLDLHVLHVCCKQIIKILPDLGGHAERAAHVYKAHSK